MWPVVQKWFRIVHELLKPRDLRKEDCQPVPGDKKGHDAWLIYHQRWKEAGEYDPVAYAIQWLAHIQTDTLDPKRKFSPYLPLVGATDDQIARLVQEAKTDFKKHDFLRAWVEGELWMMSDPLSPALAPFRKQLDSGKRPSARGSHRKHGYWPDTSLRALAEALKVRYGCGLYGGGALYSKTTAAEIISEATFEFRGQELSAKDVKHKLARRGAL